MTQQRHPSAGGAEEITWTGAAAQLGLLVAIVAGTAAIVVTMAPSGMLQPGAGTDALDLHPIAFAGLYALGTCVFIPKPALGAVAGLAFGVPLGLLVALAGNVCGALLGYGAARFLGGDAQRLLGYRSRRFGELSARLVERPFLSVFWLRITPGMPFAAVNLAAGSSRLPAGPFALATALGTLPATAACVSLGRAVTSPTSPAVWGPFVAALIVLATVVLVRRRHQPESMPIAANNGGT